MFHALPFTTFGEIAALGLKATIYCSRCYEHRPSILLPSLSATAVSRRPDSAAHKIRYTGNVCGCVGAVEIEPSAPLSVGGEYNLAFLSCANCTPPWQINFVPIDEPPWSVVDWDCGDRFKCPWLPSTRSLAHS
jgi:hypothetical protein